jgi:hypothetical protein
MIALSTNTGWVDDAIYVPVFGLPSINSRDTTFVGDANWATTTSGQAYKRTTNNSIRISAGGQPGSTIWLTHAQPFACADVTLRFEIITKTDNTASDFEHVALSLTLDGSNYVRVRRRGSADFGQVYDVLMVLGGTTLTSGYIAANGSIGELRIIYASGSMTILARDDRQSWSIIGYTRAWVSPFAASVAVSTTNGTSTEMTDTRLISFTSKLNMLYGAEPSVFTSVSAYEVIAPVPDPKWVSHEITPVSLTLFDHLGVRDTGTFNYRRSGYSRIKQTSTIAIDYIQGMRRAGKQMVPMAEGDLFLPFWNPHMM